MLTLRRARAQEAAALSDLCLRAKAIWGYDRAFLEACRAELTFAAHQLESPLMSVAERAGVGVGVAQLGISGCDSELLKLFVEPSAIRTGVGQALFDWARTAALAAGARRLVIESDPAAAGFYRRMGASPAGDAASGSVPGRRIPRLVLMLN